MSEPHCRRCSRNTPGLVGDLIHQRARGRYRGTDHDGSADRAGATDGGVATPRRVAINDAVAALDYKVVGVCGRVYVGIPVVDVEPAFWRRRGAVLPHHGVVTVPPEILATRTASRS